MICLILLISTFALIYYFLHRYYNYWKAKGIPGPEPRWLVGNIGSCFMFKKSLGDIVTEVYNQYRDSPLVGIYRSISPLLVIRDPDIIKDITVKAFTHFHDNDMDVDIEIDPLFGRNPFFLNGEKWKIARSQLTPCFTSGKMKSLFPLLDSNSREMVKYIENELKNLNNCLEAKELCTKFTLNNVASCAFGLDGKCFENPNSEFRVLAKKFLTPSGWSAMVFVFTFLLPRVVTFFKVKMVKKEIEDQLINIVEETLKYRRENNIERNDFLQIMNQLKTTCKDFEFTDLDITAHAAGFFGDGYETSSIVMSFILYELANNPHIQEKLREEVQQGFESNKGELTYDALQSMSYLEAIFNESLRLHPVLSVLMKRCTKDYTYYPKPGSTIKKPVLIEKNTSIALPVEGLHRDPLHYENPDKFIPERFLEENKNSINKYAYLPFGEGPRNCLGQRFGYLQIKTGLAYIINNFELSVNSKTKRPLQYDPFYFMLSPIGGLWLNYKKI